MNKKKTLTVGEHTFELVDSIPRGYGIWHIGKYMPDGYLPLCRLSQRQPFPGGRKIETDTLKAIEIEGAQTILAAIGWGTDTIEEMERYVSRHRNAKEGSKIYEHVQKVKAALPIMRQLKWK